MKKNRRNSIVALKKIMYEKKKSMFLIMLRLPITFFVIGLVGFNFEIIVNADTTVNFGNTAVLLEYGPNTYFTDNGAPCDDHGEKNVVHSYVNEKSCNCKCTYNGIQLKSTQCFGYAVYVQQKLFGINQVTNSNSFYNVDGANVSRGSLTAQKMKSIMTSGKVQPGAHIRTYSNGKYAHSLVVTQITNTGFSVIDCNSDGHCKVLTRDYTWESYVRCTYGTRGIDYIKMPINYTLITYENPIIDTWYYDGATDNSDFRPVIRFTNPETVANVKFAVRYEAGDWKWYDGEFNGGNAWYCDVLTNDLGEGKTITCHAYVTGKNGSYNGYPYTELHLDQNSDPEVINWYYDGATERSDFRPVIRFTNPKTVSNVRFAVRYEAGDWKWYDGEFNGGNAWYCDVLASDLGEGEIITCHAYVTGKNGSYNGYPYTELHLDQNNNPEVINWYYDGATEHSDFRPVIRFTNPETVSSVKFAVRYEAGDWKWYDGEFNGGNAWYCDVLASDLGEGKIITCHAYVTGKNGSYNGYPYTELHLDQDSDPEVINWYYDGATEHSDFRPVIRFANPKAVSNVKFALRYEAGDWKWYDGEFNGGNAWYCDVLSSDLGEGKIITCHVYVTGKNGSYKGYPYVELQLDKDCDNPVVTRYEYSENSNCKNIIPFVCIDNPNTVLNVDFVFQKTSEEWLWYEGEYDNDKIWSANALISEMISDNEMDNLVSCQIIVTGKNGSTSNYKLSDCDMDSYNHSWDEGSVTKEAACTKNGIRTFKCTVCETIKEEEIKAIGHIEVIDEGIEPTCLKTGLTRGSHCSVCGEILVAQEVVDAKGHSWSLEYTIDQEPTCTEAGRKSYHCLVCGEINPLSVTSVEALGHTFGEWEVLNGSSCTENGGKKRTCSICNYVETEGIDATGHAWEDQYTIDKEATCTEAGSKSYHCQKCDAIKDSEVIPATGHTEVIDQAIEATCTEVGKTEGKHCSVCEIIIVEQKEILALGHKEVIDKDEVATCTQPGKTAGKHCSVCREVLVAQKEIPATGHTQSEAVKEYIKNPSCTENGLYDSVVCCSVCKEELTRTTIVVNAIGHNYGEWTIDEEATCIKEGQKSIHCNVCGVIKEGSVESLPKAEHEWDEGIITKNPTCTESGIKTFTCPNCHQTKTEIIPSPGHIGDTIVKFAKVVTCTVDGYSGDTYCQACGQMLKEGHNIPATGHKWDEGSVTKAVTCTENGVMTYVCTVCKEKKTENITCDGHIGETEIKNVLSATCIKEGYTGDECCKACNAVISSGVATAKAEHQWNEGSITKQATCTYSGEKTFVCTACGTERVEIIPAIGHSRTTVMENAKPASCTATGYTGDVCCASCGALIRAGQVSPATGHSWDEGKVTAQPTEFTRGVMTYTCKKCKTTRTETVEAIGLKVGTKIKDTRSNGYYKVSKDGYSLEYTGPVNKKKSSVSIPDSVKYKGSIFKVTSIAANALKGNKRIKKVTIGNNVTSIGNKAFYGCKKLKRITIKTKKLTNKKVGSMAFGGISSKPTVSVPKSVYSSYKKLLKAKGMSRKARYKKF